MPAREGGQAKRSPECVMRARLPLARFSQYRKHRAWYCGEGGIAGGCDGPVAAFALRFSPARSEL